MLINYFILIIATGQPVNHWCIQGDQPQEKDNYTNTVSLAKYLNACIHQLQINQLIATQLNGGVKGSNLATIVLGKKLNLYGLINGSE